MQDFNNRNNFLYVQSKVCVHPTGHHHALDICKFLRCKDDICIYLILSKFIFPSFFTPRICFCFIPSTWLTFIVLNPSSVYKNFFKIDHGKHAQKKKQTNGMFLSSHLPYSRSNLFLWQTVVKNKPPLAQTNMSRHYNRLLIESASEQFMSNAIIQHYVSHFTVKADYSA